MTPSPGPPVAQHPLRLDLLLLASWPHARFHPCRCSPDNPACRKGWRDSVCFALGSIITTVITIVNTLVIIFDVKKQEGKKNRPKAVIC
jgi:hypothetical protein